MTGLTLCRRARRAPLYQAILRDLQGIAPAAHLIPKPPAPDEPDKQQRHRSQSQGFRRFGDVTQTVAC